MSYTIATAAAATGLSKATILEAITDGTIAGTRDERGEWCVEPAELHRVFPVVPWHEPDEDGPPIAGPDVEALGAQIEALLRRAGARLRQQLDEVRSDADAG